MPAKNLTNANDPTSPSRTLIDPMSWNKPSSAPQQPPKKSAPPSLKRGILAGLLVVALGALCYFMFRPSAAAPKRDSAKDRGLIKEVTPAAAPTNAVAKAEAKPVRRTKKGTPIPDRVQPDEHGVLRYSNGQRWVDTNDLHLVRHPHQRVLFKNMSENRIATMLRLDPTRMAPFLVGRRPKFDERFVEDFKASFDSTVVIDKEDTPEEAELRKAVIETKADLKAALDRGEDIAKIMNDTQAELDRLCQYHDEMRKAVREAMHNPELSDDDVKDYVTAANQLLRKQGIREFAMPSLVRRQARLLLQREKLKSRTQGKEGSR